MNKPAGLIALNPELEGLGLTPQEAADVFVEILAILPPSETVGTVTEKLDLEAERKLQLGEAEGSVRECWDMDKVESELAEITARSWDEHGDMMEVFSDHGVTQDMMVRWLMVGANSELN